MAYIFGCYSDFFFTYWLDHAVWVSRYRFWLYFTAPTQRKIFPVFHYNIFNFKNRNIFNNLIVSFFYAVSRIYRYFFYFVFRAYGSRFYPAVFRTSHFSRSWNIHFLISSNNYRSSNFVVRILIFLLVGLFSLLS